MCGRWTRGKDFKGDDGTDGESERLFQSVGCAWRPHGGTKYNATFKSLRQMLYMLSPRATCTANVLCEFSWSCNTIESVKKFIILFNVFVVFFWLTWAFSSNRQTSPSLWRNWYATWGMKILRWFSRYLYFAISHVQDLHWNGHLQLSAHLLSVGFLPEIFVLLNSFNFLNSFLKSSVNN